jgi:SH3-like domain-containing protein
MELAETDRPADPHLSPAREASQKPPDVVPSGEVIFEEKPVEAKIQEIPKTSAQPDKTVTDQAPSARDKPKEVSVEKTEASSPGKWSVGKRFFVQRGLANVRSQPSMKSKVLFQIPNGSSVTVTDKRKGWYRVKTDDGRLGWVYHSILAGSPVPQKDLLPALLKLKAIRVEPPVNQTGKVFFELSAPYVPEIVILEDDATRIVCDFVNARLARHISRRIAINDSMIQTIRIGLHQRPQAKVRVVLDLAPGRRYEPKQVSLEGEDCFVLEITAVEDP